MKYRVLGPRILLKVPKIDKHFPGTMIEVAPEIMEKETTSQTVAIIEQIGPSALSNEDFGAPDSNLKIGDRVHFAKYGAVRLKTSKEDVHEYWIINAKDLLCIEEV